MKILSWINCSEPWQHMHDSMLHRKYTSKELRILHRRERDDTTAATQRFHALWPQESGSVRFGVLIVSGFVHPM